MLIRIFCVLCFLVISVSGNAQVESSQTGAWYMYFFNKQFNESQFGIQGDVQYRNWDVIGDLEQLLIRTGLTYTPKSTNLLLTLGYASITSGEFGDGNETSHENRIYQEALFPQKIGNRVLLTHRFRYEQRFVEDQDFRTRYRYNLFLNVALNQKEMEQKTLYLALYNELFINGQKNIGDGKTVETFDRNRFYSAMGYVIKKGLKVQLGWMRQSTDSNSKDQLQLSLHHTL